MQDEDAIRERLIDMLLNYKKPGWADCTKPVRYKEMLNCESDVEIEVFLRRKYKDAWAYRDQLSNMPSDELRNLATPVEERLRQEAAAAEHKRLQEERHVLYAKWARKPYWSQSEAEVLILGGNPDNDSRWTMRSDSMSDINDLLNRAIRCFKLDQNMTPSSVIDFLRSVNFSVPEGLAEAVDALRPPKSVIKATPETPPTQPTFEIDGYDCPDELSVLMEAINKFWVNVDDSRKPKKEEIISWIRERVDSESKANAIDILIRPEWARDGGNSKRSKG